MPLSNQVHHHPQCHQHFYIVLHLLYFSLSSHNKICQLSLWYGMVWLESEGGADRVTPPSGMPHLHPPLACSKSLGQIRSPSRICPIFIHPLLHLQLECTTTASLSAPTSLLLLSSSPLWDLGEAGMWKRWIWDLGEAGICTHLECHRSCSMHQVGGRVSRPNTSSHIDPLYITRVITYQNW